MLAFSKALKLEKPVICGFSDGGIVALLAAIRLPELPGALIACGSQYHPGRAEVAGAPGYGASLPGVPEAADQNDALSAPDLPGYVRAYSGAYTGVVRHHDMIRPADSRAIAAAIPGAQLQELPHEGHGTYIVHSPKLAHLVLAFLRSL